MKEPSPNHDALVRLIKPAERVTFAEIAKTIGCTSQAVRLWFGGATPSDEYKLKLEEHFGLPRDGWGTPRAKRTRAA